VAAQAAVHEGATVVTELGLAVDRVVAALLDGEAPRALALDLEHAVVGVDVPADPHLVATTPTLEVGAVRHEVGGVEVDRGVAELAPFLDLQGGPRVVECEDEPLEGSDGYDVLPVHAGQQSCAGVEGAQVDRRQVVDGATNLLRGRRGRRDPPGLDTEDGGHAMASCRSRSSATAFVRGTFTTGM
jgi:hypothetical protein